MEELETKIEIQDVSQIMLSETLEWELTVNGKPQTLRIHESDYEGRTIWWNGDEWDQDEDLEDITADLMWGIVDDAIVFRHDDLSNRY